MDDYSSNPYAGAAFLAILGVLLIPMLIVAFITVISKWQLFTKAGRPGWAAIIPIYSTIVMLEIIGKPVWWIFLILFPCTTFIFYIWATNLLSKSFGQSEGFTIGLLVLPFIFYPILAFGNYAYVGPAGLPNGFNGSGPFNNPPQV